MKKLQNIVLGVSQQQNAEGKMETVETWYANFTEETKFGNAQMQVQIPQDIAEKVQKLVALD